MTREVLGDEDCAQKKPQVTPAPITIPHTPQLPNSTMAFSATARGSAE